MTTLARLINRALAHVPVPAAMVHRWWSRCPFCGVWRRDPTDYCGTCGL